MAQKIIDYYNWINNDLSDPRTKDWFLMSSPFPILTITLLYLWISTKAGPHFMKNRKSFALTTTLKWYNLLQVIFSMYLAYEGIKLWQVYNYKCEPVDYSHSKLALAAASGTYMYFIAKLTELLDTVFFVLRKKFSQVSTLHLYHHTTMLLITWTFAKYFGGGLGTLSGTLNSIVHVVMYFYYFLAAFGDKYKKYLWWKKHLTLMQMLQFAIVMLHSLQALPRKCDYPKTILVIFVLQGSVFTYMFGSFYVRTYMRPKKTAKIASNGNHHSIETLTNGKHN